MSLHHYEVHLWFSSTMNHEELISSIEELLPDASYQVAETGAEDV